MGYRALPFTMDQRWQYGGTVGLSMRCKIMPFKGIFVLDSSPGPPLEGLAIRSRSAKRGAQGLKGMGTGVNANGRFQDHLNQMAKDTDSQLAQLLGAAPVKHGPSRPEGLLGTIGY